MAKRMAKKTAREFSHDRIIEADLRPVALHGDWLTASARFTRAVTEVCTRFDLAVRIAPGGGKGAPACFIRPKATVEINAELLKVNPATVNPEDPEDRKRYPVAWCGLVHEASHADHTEWTDRVKERETPRAVLEAALLLEESRIEAQHLRRRPEDRDVLRAGNQEVVLAPTKGQPIMSVSQAMKVAGLILARVDAGTFTEDDVAEERAKVIAALGSRASLILEKAQKIWRAAQTTDDFDTKGMLRLGREWAELAGEDTSKTADNASGTMSTESGEPEGAERGRTNRTYEGGIPKVVKSGGEDSDAKDGKGGKGKGGKDGKGDGEGEGDSERTAKERIEREVKKMKRAGHGPGSVPLGSGRGLTGWRDPTEDEKAAARRLTRRLMKAMLRERTEMPLTSELPPGRVRMRSAISRDVQIDSGRMPTAEPFRRKEHKSNPMPPLRAGVCMDISGSMTSVIGPASQAAWIVARAVAKYPESRHMFMTFADYLAEPVIFPREVPEKVPEIETGGGDECMSKAIDILDGSLGLSRPGAARLLVCLTDAMLTITAEGKRVHKQVQRLVASGCRVLWITQEGPLAYQRPDPYGPYLNTIPQVRAVHIPESMMEANMPDIIIDEVVRVLKDTQ